MSDRPIEFVSYTDRDPACAVMAITPPPEAYMHTYYDVCPWSPSGRYFACLRLPQEDREPAPDDRATLCVIDLQRRVVRDVAETAGWGFQTAAHQQWGGSDRYLYFNDKADDRPIGVKLDLITGEARTLGGPIWAVDPAEAYAICTCLNRGRLTQGGYGLTVRPEHHLTNTVTAAADDGLYRVDLATGEQSLLVSLADVWDVLPDRADLAGGVLYAFHCKINPQGTRIMIVVRCRFDDGKFIATLVTCRPDGSDLRTTVPHRLWRRGGHHPIWHPDGERVLMNLTPGPEGMRLCVVDVETGQVDVLTDDPPGMGHPSISPDGRWLLTDETRESGDVRTAAVRLVDLAAHTWRDLCSATSPAVGGSPLRRDAHPVWDRPGLRIAFLAAPTGRRQLYIADPALPAGECFL